MIRLRALALAAACLGLPAAGWPMDLVEAWRAAQEHDLDFAAARAAHDAGVARRSEGSALWRPSVQATGSVGRMSNSTDFTGAHFAAPGLGQSNGVDFGTSVNDGNATSWAVTARQPLLSGERLAQSRQLELSGDVADLQWDAARQALMLRTAERYFEAVVAEETLRVLREQQGAAEEALSEAQERYRIGDIPVTDSHEANARAQGIRAQVLAAESDLELKRYALSDITGIAPRDLVLKVPSDAPAPGEAALLDNWLERTAQNNPELRMESANLAVAQQDVARTRAGSGPSLDFVARVGRDRLSGSGDFGAASNAASNGMIGLQLTVPVFTGGYRSAQHEEALGMAEKARAEEARTRQQVAQRTRSSWLGLTVGATRAEALAAARQASLARLEATRLGHHVGDRSTLDLLNAQSDAAGAELNLLQARIGLLTERLRLAALAGALDEEQLRAASAGLQPRELPR
jgi:outer membrane protein